MLCVKNKILHLETDKEKIRQLSVDNEKRKLEKNKGYLCSINGNKYEKRIYDITKHTSIHGKPFNTQKEKDLAGSSSKNDLECNFISKNDIGIEIKKHNTPDWMQCVLKYDEHTKKLIPTKNGKIPEKCRDLFTILIDHINPYNGHIPPFMKKAITHEKWLSVKKSTNLWNDLYVDVPSNTISKLYQSKGCHYIQISDGYGLFHLGHDKCGFNVPPFEIEQQIRFRTKIHKRKNKKGFCNLSVTVSCQPKNIKNLQPSPYTLDNTNKLPPPITYHHLTNNDNLG